MAKAKGSPLRSANLFLLAAAVGALGGLVGHAFQAAIRFFQVLGLADGDTIVEAGDALPDWLRVLVPAAGGLLAALCLLAVAGKRSPFGVTDVMELVLTRRGAIRFRQSLMLILSSGCSICTGSSIGREAANSQIGATAASAFGRLFGCSSRDRAVLLGCGVAAGMAVSYNAPIAGALFVMEVVLGNFAMDVFAPIVVSAVIATLVHNGLHPSGTGIYGEGIASTIRMSDPRLVLAAVLLGGICGLGAIGFRRALQAGAWAFGKLRAPALVTLPLGGAIVGVIGIWYPEVWGNGYHVAHGIITNDAAIGGMTMIIAIMLLKVVATSVSLGSGSLGGIFTPNLVVGAALGATYAHLVGGVVPATDLGLASNQELSTGFALVGMAGLCAATAHAPITAVLLVFEFTRNYELMLPVMICSIIGSLVARLLDRESIYSARLRAKGHDLAGGIEALAMKTNYVRDIMRTDTVVLRHNAAFEAVMDAFAQARRDTAFVVDANGSLLGRIHIHDVKFYMNEPDLTAAVIAADLTRPAPAVSPDQSLAEIFHQFDDPDLDVLPVTDPDTGALTGRLTRRDVIALLTSEVLGQRNLRARLKAEGAEESTYVELPADADLARLDLPGAMAGRSLGELDLPGQKGLTVLLVIETGTDGVERRILASPEQPLPRRAALVVLGSKTAIAAFEAELGDQPGDQVGDL